jgi:DNA-binding PadR family transcriptional regulator
VKAWRLPHVSIKQELVTKDNVFGNDGQFPKYSGVEGVSDSVDGDDRRKALQGHFDEMRRHQRDEQRERREAIKSQVDEMKKLQKGEQQERKKAIAAQIEELKRLHAEQQESQRAVLEKINELKRLDREKQCERRKTLREQFAEKVDQIREEHVREHHTNAGQEHQFMMGDPETRKGFLKIHILLALSVRPAHGYELMHWISHHTGHAWSPSPGSMYPALDSLESKGFIACQGDGRRKVYSLTSKGEDSLARMNKKQEEQFSEMKTFISTLLDG